VIQQTTHDLEEAVGSKYALVIVAAKRARQLKGGDAPRVDGDGHPLTIALDELIAEEVHVLHPQVEETPDLTIGDDVSLADLDAVLGNAGTEDSTLADLSLEDFAGMSLSDLTFGDTPTGDATPPAADAETSE
jgi:DNA-directed RNA polymerase omega subunit